jgi:hypothetical protein
MACCNDIAGQVRGKAFPARDFERRCASGIGWCPTNVQITAFDQIAETPFGALGDLLLMPDPTTRVEVDFGPDDPGDRLVLCDLMHTDGRPWECCLRAALKDALGALEAETGLNPGFSVVGNLRMAQTKERMDEYMLYASTAETVGIHYEWLTPSDIRERWPLIRTDAHRIPAAINPLRVIDIVGLDKQADGGTHVGSTAEVGRVRVVKIESKGKANKRVRLALEDLPE